VFAVIDTFSPEEALAVVNRKREINLLKKEIEMRMKTRSMILLASLMLALFLSPQAHGQAVRGEGLLEAGPLPQGAAPPVSLFPSWFMDKTGLALEPCLDGPPLCLSSLADFSNPAIGEAFYWSASTDLGPVQGATGFVELALEAAFLNPAQIRANAMVFNRLRIRLDNLPAVGDYTIQHPFGQVTIAAVQDPDPRKGININSTTDLPGSAGPRSYRQVLNARNIGPFLRQVNSPPGFLGTPNIARPVTGGINGNAVIVTGPGGFTMSSNLFAVEGKMATNGGLSRVRASYSREADGSGLLHVSASSIGFQAIFAIRRPLPNVRLKAFGGQRVGDYAANIPFTANQPFEPLIVRNRTDASNPSRTFTTVPDLVTISRATFTPGAAGQPGTLIVRAFTSDNLAPRPRLQLMDQGGNVLQTRRGVINFTAQTIIKPARVQVTSSAGGNKFAEVQTVQPAP
jgi:hypothetical protein